MKHLWEASLLDKETDEMIDSILVEARDKRDAITAARQEFAARQANYFEEARVWVTLVRENTRPE